jgi:hypothetical protein
MGFLGEGLSTADLALHLVSSVVASVACAARIPGADVSY